MPFTFLLYCIHVVLSQRTFAGVVDPKAEKPVAHIDVDDLHMLSAPEHPDPAKRTEVGACTIATSTATSTNTL